MGPYVYRQDDRIVTTYEYADKKYDYFSQDFYRLPLESKDTVFTDVYYDEALDKYIITCSSPIWGNDRAYLGCTTIDMELDSLETLINNYSGKHIGEMYIISNDGQYLADCDSELVKSGGNIMETACESFQPLVKELMMNDSGQGTYTDNGEKVFVYYDTLAEFGWKTVYEIPEN
ncbi:MAG TPA: cache domain-containing protein [Lachnospiraceae bacterium]|nr:cache domain-containing protein [Lachnospiraceae bacterium]